MTGSEHLKHARRHPWCPTCRRVVVTNPRGLCTWCEYPADPPKAA